MSAGAVYFGSAAIVALLGAALLAWALFADRSRGRKRCPRCWYDMSAAVNLRCPECGWEVKHEKQLLKTRRRWKAAFATLLPFALAGFLALQPKVQRDGWWSIMPTTVMLLYFQFKQDDAVVAAIDERAIVPVDYHQSLSDPSTLYRWQWRWLAKQVISRLDEENQPVGRIRQYFQWSSALQDVFEHDEGLRQSITQAMVRYFDHDDQLVRSAAAIYCVDRFDPEGTVQHLARLLHHDDAKTRQGAVTGLRLALHYTHSDVVIDQLIAVLDHDDPETWGFAAGALGAFARYSGGESRAAKEALRRAIDRTDEKSDWYRYWMVTGFAAYASNEEVVPFLHKWLVSDDPNMRAGALSVLADGRVPQDRFIGYVIVELESDGATEAGRYAANWILHHFRPARLLEPYEARIAALLEHEDEGTRNAARAALSELGQLQGGSP